MLPVFQPHILLTGHGNEIHMRVFVPMLYSGNINNLGKLNQNYFTEILQMPEYELTFIKIILNTPVPNTNPSYFWDYNEKVFRFPITNQGPNWGFGAALIDGDGTILSYTYNTIRHSSPSDHDSPEGPFLCMDQTNIYSITKVSDKSGNSGLRFLQGTSEFDHELTNGTTVYQNAVGLQSSVDNDFFVNLNIGGVRKPRRRAKSSLAIARDPKNNNIV